jgi:predicted nucleic acid-binding protein
MRAERVVLDTNVLIGDRDLLVLNPFQGVPILTPAGFLEAIAWSGT